MPEKSPYLTIRHESDYLIAEYNGERIPFLTRDVTTLPLANTTVEEFSHYFLNKLLDHPDFDGEGIVALTVKVSSSPGQLGCAEWVIADGLEGKHS